MKQNARALAGKALIDCAVESAFDKKAEDVTQINLESISGIADWFVVCQGDNPLHNKAIADAIIIELKARNTRPWHVEGYEQGRWILIDYSDVIIHIMLPEIREYYQLEDLWEDSSAEKVMDKKARGADTGY